MRKRSQNTVSTSEWFPAVVYGQRAGNESGLLPMSLSMPHALLSRSPMARASLHVARPGRA